MSSVCTGTALVVLLAAGTLGAAPVSSVSYSRQIAPLLNEKCGACHSPDARTSGFDATSIDGLRKGGKKAGAAVIPGDAAKSPLIQYVSGLRQPRMPNGMAPLSAAEIGLIRNWISAGAKDDSPAVNAKAFVTPKLQGADKLLNDALFADAAQMLVLRRKVRLQYVPKPPDPPADPSLSNPLDRFVAAKWKADGLPQAKTPPALSSDDEFLRRVYLDVIGLIPTAEEAQEFLSSTDPDKRTKLIDELLNRKDGYAANWTPWWEDALGSVDTGVVGGIVRRGDYKQWIYDSFVANKPYDVMVAELIDPSMPGHKATAPKTLQGGKVVVPSYILNDNEKDTLLSAADTAQVFLGTGMKCATCHNHFLNREWPQTRFYAFAGLFGPKNLEVVRCERPTGKIISAKFAFTLPDVPATVPEGLDARLHRLAVLLTDPTDERFSKTIVNRLWKRYLGLGLFEPADDYRLDRPPSDPAMLNWMAYDFMAHGYDLKHTIRLILTSRTYQLKYDPKLEDHYNVAQPTAPRYFRSPSLRRLTAEELIDSIRLAVAQKLEPDKRLYLTTTSTDLTRALGRPATRNQISTQRSGEVAVVQALELLNGHEFHDLIYNGPILKTLADETANDKVVSQLYWDAFSRPPTPAESAAGEQFLERAGSQAPKTEIVGDMLWAMFSSPAFQYID